MTNHVDFETRSAVNLSHSGIHIYATHPSTEILCVAFSLDGGETVDCWTQGQAPPRLLLEAVRRGETFWAFNAEFERHIWQEVAAKRLGWPPVDQWKCTMVLAAYAGLPTSLEHACHVARTTHRKSKKGHALMMRMTKHTAAEKDTPEKFAELAEYCKQDVRAEAELHRTVAGLKSVQFIAKMEEPARLMDRVMNDRGAPIDVATCRGIAGLIKGGGNDFHGEMAEVTGGYVTKATQATRLKDWLNARGVDVPNTTADVLQGTLKTCADKTACRAIQIRLAAAQTSTAKFAKILSGVSPDGRARGLFQFYGASQTGRYAGRRIQLQNLPRLNKKYADWIDCAAHAFVNQDAAFVKLIFGDVLTGAKQMIRPCIWSPEGITVADASQIELRINAWLADETKLLRVFATDGDPYIGLAEQIFHRKLTKENKDERQVGKVGMLGCGYQMGIDKFAATLEKFGIPGTAEDHATLAAKTVPAFRELYPNIKQLWWKIGDAAMRAFRDGCRADVGRLAFLRPAGTDMLLMRLPSGRMLHYWHVQIDQGQYGAGLSCETVRNKKVIRSHLYGGKWLENACQAISRDLIIHAMLKLHHAGQRLIGMVHDEIIGEGHAADLYIDAMTKDLPAWADGLPPGAEAAECYRYTK